MKILAISGSLRSASFNTQLLQLAANCMPDSIELTLYTCHKLPLYNQELDGDVKPVAVQELLNLVASADALLIATPEYNYSLPGVLKNAIDWASRPAFDSVLKNRPTAVISASMSGLGGIRAQIHLKQILGGTLTPVFPAADFLVASAHTVFAADGSLNDSTLQPRLQQYVTDYIDWLDTRQS